VILFFLEFGLLLFTLFGFRFVLLLLLLLLFVVILPLCLRSVTHAILLVLVVVLLVHARHRHVRHLHAHLCTGHTTHVVPRHVRHAAQVVEPRQTAHGLVGQPSQPGIELQVQWIVHHAHPGHHAGALLVLVCPHAPLRMHAWVQMRVWIPALPLVGLVMLAVLQMRVGRVSPRVIWLSAHAHVKIRHLPHIVQL